MGDRAAHLRLMLTGKMGCGKTSAGDYLQDTWGAVRWTRTESMKALAHALVDQVGDIDPMLENLLRGDDCEKARRELLRYAAGYTPEPGKPRKLYQDVAQIVINHDPLAFERELMARMARVESELSGPVFSLVDDVRSRHAFEFFAGHGYRSVRINASEDVRKARMLARDGYLPAPATFAHPSETELDTVEHDLVVLNDYSDPAEFQAALDAVVRELGWAGVRRG